jgi:hypothetical protein
MSFFWITGGFQTTFRITSMYLKAGTSFLYSVTGRMLELVSNFHGRE